MRPCHVRDAARLGLACGFDEHSRLWVNPDGVRDVLGEGECELSCATAQVEQTPRAVETELPDEVVDERLRIAWPIACVVPGSSRE